MSLSIPHFISSITHFARQAEGCTRQSVEELGWQAYKGKKEHLCSMREPLRLRSVGPKVKQIITKKEVIWHESHFKEETLLG